MYKWFTSCLLAPMNQHPNLSTAWIDVRKAYDSVDHDWLCAMTDVHRLPIWLGEAIRKLCASWNTRVVAATRQGRETPRKIRFMKGLPQGGALCPRLFTLCLNPVAWRLRATGGIPVIQTYRSQSHRSPVYRRPEGFCCLREQAEPSAEGD